MSKLSPSKAHRYLNCTKSLDFDTEFVETPATIRGNILHKFAEMSLKEEDTTDFVKENIINDYEHFLITGYVKAVWQEFYRIQADKIEIEDKQPTNIFGNDINLIVDVLLLARTVASIIDLKTGNADVDVENNEQLFFYAYHILTKYPTIQTLRLSIFQKGKLKTTTATREEVLDFFVDKYDVFESIRKNELTYNPSTKACKYCANNKACVARAKWIIGGKQ